MLSDVHRHLYRARRSGTLAPALMSPAGGRLRQKGRGKGGASASAMEGASTINDGKITLFGTVVGLEKVLLREGQGAAGGGAS